MHSVAGKTRPAASGWANTDWARRAEKPPQNGPVTASGQQQAVKNRSSIATILLVLAAAAFTLLSFAPIAALVLRGFIDDPDDAMRLVEIRAWRHTQAWFDLSAHRLDPTVNSSMHWSRLVDLPPALLIRLFEVFTDAAHAERCAAIAVPSVLLVLLYAAMARFAELLLGRDARATALLGLAASGAALIMFVPGRIGHHGPETLLLLVAVTAALASFDPAKAVFGAVAGAIVALALSLSLETFPFLGLLSLLMVAAWVLRGAEMARALACFAIGLGTTLPLVFLVTVAPANWFAPVCDAFGPAHLGAGMLGAAGALAMSRAALSWPLRGAAAAATGAVVLLFVGAAYPSCLKSPFAAVDPLVRALWLDNVVESLSFVAFARRWPFLGVTILLPILLGLVGAVCAAIRQHGTASLRFAAIAAIVAFGLGLGFVQVRVFASITPLALLGSVYAVMNLREHISRRSTLVATVLPLAILPFTGTFWSFVLPDDAQANVAHSACLGPAAMAPLAHLRPGSVVAPIVMGSALLVDTSLDVFAAPYHRNNDGNRFAFDVFLARQDRASELLASRAVSYVMICPALGETASEAARAPNSLAAELLGGRIPPYLSRVPLPDTSVQVFRVRSGK